jgi:hypothetical protein
LHTPRALVLVFAFVLISMTIVNAQTWTQITNTPPFNPGAMLLLTDGRVLVHSEPNCTSCQSTDYSSWYTFTPDINGSYLNGTWTEVAAPTGYSPLYFGSAVLADGKVIVEGGEYDCSSGTCEAAWQDHGAFYDPVTNTWAAISPPAKPFKWTSIGDAQSVVLADGTYMQANCCGVVLDGAKNPQAAVFHESTRTWSEVKDTGKADEFDEEGWTLLPNGEILTVDAYVGSFNSGTCTTSSSSPEPTACNSEVYNPATQTWTSAGSTVVQLWDSCESTITMGKTETLASYELGPAVLRPDGTVFYTGSNSCGPANTAIYNSNTGNWTAGPAFPALCGPLPCTDGDAPATCGDTCAVNDGPATLEINGNVLVFASTGAEFSPPGQFFEWNGTTLYTFTTPTTAVSDGSYVGHLLLLPNGQIMFTDFSTNVWILTSAGTYNPSWAPTITKLAATNIHPGQLSVKLTGTQLNGLSQGAFYGDDYQDATNYPLVRITNNSSGNVFYCRTHNHSSMGVATGPQTVYTYFDVPADTELGESQLVVVANGIPSSPVTVKIVGPVQTH